MRLFVERARSASRGDELRPDDDVVGEIVRRLDGNPLALELAAARVRGLGVMGLRDRLDDRFAVLASPSRARLGRHQTLETALDWSVRLLNDDERTLFTRMSVFNGGFDLDAACAVCGFEPLARHAIANLTTELVDKSLVTLATGVGRRRYRLLESLRAYGAARVDPAERRRIREAHAEHYGRLAREATDRLRGPRQTAWLSTLRQEQDNLRSALRWSADHDPAQMVRTAVSLGPYWESVGPRSEGHDWLRRAVEVSDDLDPALRIDALLVASDLSASGSASLPLHYPQRALALAIDAGDEIAEAKALRTLSWALALDEQPDEARRVGRRALEILERHDDPWELALCLERLGQAGHDEPEGSIATLERALQLYRRVGDRRREAVVLYKLADRVAQLVDGVPTAIGYAEQAIQIADEMGNTHDGAHARLEHGKILRRAGRPADAAAVLSQALADTVTAGDERCRVRALGVLGTTLVDTGDVGGADAALRESLRRGRHLGEADTARVAITGLARIHAGAGRHWDAATLLAVADRLATRIGAPASDQTSADGAATDTALRDLLGDAHEAAWARGRAMALADAVELALDA